MVFLSGEELLDIEGPGWEAFVGGGEDAEDPRVFVERGGREVCAGGEERADDLGGEWAAESHGGGFGWGLQEGQRAWVRRRPARKAQLVPGPSWVMPHLMQVRETVGLVPLVRFM